GRGRGGRSWPGRRPARRGPGCWGASWGGGRGGGAARHIPHRSRASAAFPPFSASPTPPGASPTAPPWPSTASPASCASCSDVSAPSSRFRRRVVAVVGRQLEELLGLVRPELRHHRVGVDHGVLKLCTHALA